MVEEFQQYSVQFRRHNHLTQRMYRDITSLYTPRRHGRSNHSSPLHYMTVTSPATLLTDEDNQVPFE
jgi:hypothetical protein